jgi:hypothetical protein
MRYFLVLVICLCFSCKEEDDSVISNQKKFDMYEMSEMSLFMEQMYIDNQRLKQRILKGDTLGKFPSSLLRIHKAAMTDQNKNDVFFKQHANEFIQSQELIYQDSINALVHFNKSIDQCIQCHQVKCVGPIARIKKLYLKV